jgi:hypothetical protein
MDAFSQFIKKSQDLPPKVSVAPDYTPRKARSPRKPKVDYYSAPIQQYQQVAAQAGPVYQNLETVKQYQLQQRPNYQSVIVERIPDQYAQQQQQQPILNYGLQAQNYSRVAEKATNNRSGINEKLKSILHERKQTPTYAAPTSAPTSSSQSQYSLQLPEQQWTENILSQLYSRAQQEEPAKQARTTNYAAQQTSAQPTAATQNLYYNEGAASTVTSDQQQFLDLYTTMYDQNQQALMNLLANPQYGLKYSN